MNNYVIMLIIVVAHIEVEPVNCLCIKVYYILLHDWIQNAAKIHFIELNFSL